ncbi:hypothetical protein CfE428DRAFT_3197 [Chthoniobacter flavus Ellin428]|uniref:Uncharacterized protein n=1 Tax=Chthoniobacter flavus Ellin428 TaxID=497964 RepID=B4D230_9BACT|nr:hypothetical protein CfE428DRAFT_3197 [Chthoniobacter flavus Ellin428]
MSAPTPWKLWHTVQVVVKSCLPCSALPFPSTVGSSLAMVSFFALASGFNSSNNLVARLATSLFG